MHAIITGVFIFDDVTVVHCIEEKSQNNNRRVEKVFLKTKRVDTSRCCVGNVCYVGQYKYKDRFYSYIRF